MNLEAEAAATPHGKRDQSKLTKMNTKLFLLSSLALVVHTTTQPVQIAGSSR